MCDFEYTTERDFFESLWMSLVSYNQTRFEEYDYVNKMKAICKEAVLVFDSMDHEDKIDHKLTKYGTECVNRLLKIAVDYLKDPSISAFYDRIIVRYLAYSHRTIRSVPTTIKEAESEINHAKHLYWCVEAKEKEQKK